MLARLAHGPLLQRLNGWHHNPQAGSIDPEWHAWLHYVSDDCPSRVTYLKPHYEVLRKGYNESAPHRPKARKRDGAHASSRVRVPCFARRERPWPCSPNRLLKRCWSTPGVGLLVQ